MEIGVLIAFGVKSKLPPTQKTKFFRELYGYIERSNYSRYTYERSGLLTGRPYISPIKSVLIIREDDKEEVVGFFKEYRVETFVRGVILTKTDMKKLKLI